MPYSRAQSDQTPGLQTWICLGNLLELPAHSTAPVVLRDADWENPTEAMAATLQAAGFSGVQGGDAKKVRALGLGMTAGGRCDAVGDLDDYVAHLIDGGSQGLTLHVGNGFEDEATADRLCDYIVKLADTQRFPISVETHRATITQDAWRTLQLVAKHPDLRFNGDFSHWYTGLEFVYGDFAGRLDALAPVFERVTHLHGRIGTPGRIQQVLTGNEEADWVGHFREIWTRVFRAFRAAAPADAILPFAAELLFSSIHYAPADDNGVELGDRWADAILMSQIARECWNAAEPVAKA